jgi:hypothetical protein
MEPAAFWVGVRWETGAPRPGHGDPRRLVAGLRDGTVLAVTLDRTPAGGAPPACGGYADEHLVADADAESAWPPVADVLIVRRPVVAPGECPGRLVTAWTGTAWTGTAWTGTAWRGAAWTGAESTGTEWTGTVGRHVVEVRGWRARLVPLTARAAGDVAPYASFVHAWTVAGRPLGALDGARLYLGALRGVRISVPAVCSSSHPTWAWPSRRAS